MASGSVLYKTTGRTLEVVDIPVSTLPPTPGVIPIEHPPVPVPKTNIPIPRSPPPSVSGDWEWVLVGSSINLSQPPQYVRVPKIPSGFNGIFIPSPP